MCNMYLLGELGHRNSAWHRNRNRHRNSAWHRNRNRHRNSARHAPTMKIIHSEITSETFLATNTILLVLSVCSLHVAQASNKFVVDLSFPHYFYLGTSEFMWAQTQVCTGVAMPLVRKCCSIWLLQLPILLILVTEYSIYFYNYTWHQSFVCLPVTNAFCV